ncbi:hypothetical protein AAC387_Pa12g0596 [Persea americana]
MPEDPSESVSVQGSIHLAIYPPLDPLSSASLGTTPNLQLTSPAPLADLVVPVDPAVPASVAPPTVINQASIPSLSNSNSTNPRSSISLSLAKTSIPTPD